MGVSTKLKAVIEHAIFLANTKGEDIKVNNLPGKATYYECGKFSLIYTTPFSGAEIYPGQLSYIMDIWVDHKKVFTHCYSDLESISSKKTKRASWVAEFMNLK